MKSYKKNKQFNVVYRRSLFFSKRGFSADAVPLSSALRPSLFNFAKILPKSSKMRNFFPINSKIVVTSTILVVLSIIFSGFLVNNTFATSITLTIPSALNVSVNPTVNSGYAKSSNGNISVAADSPFGYTLSIKSKDATNGNALFNGNDKLASVTEVISEDNYKSTGTVNTWGYIPSKVNGTANTNIRPGPNTSGETIEKTTVANASTANSYTVALVAKVNNTIPAGSYKNTFVISAVANSVTYSVTYHDSSNSATNMPSNINNSSTSNNTITLENKTPTRDGYEFLGWCNKETSDESCSGQTYQPNQTYPLVNGTNNIELWAMWKSSAPTTMQNFGNYCSSMTQHQTLTLTDSRDSKTYKIAKLKDNKCWMVENLKLVGSRTLTSSDSDVSSSFSLPASISSGFNSTTAANVHLDSTYGGYYNWYAATAGTGTSSMSSGNASSSICPKGWHLPTSGSGGEFQTMVKAYGGSGSNQNSTTVRDALMATPAPGFVYSGFYYSSSLYPTGSFGYWWSSAAYDSSSAYDLSLNSDGYVNPRSDGSKNNGLSVRCVADN